MFDFCLETVGEKMCPLWRFGSCRSVIISAAEVEGGIHRSFPRQNLVLVLVLLGSGVAEVPGKRNKRWEKWFAAVNCRAGRGHQWQSLAPPGHEAADPKSSSLLRGHAQPGSPSTGAGRAWGKWEVSVKSYFNTAVCFQQVLQPVLSTLLLVALFPDTNTIRSEGADLISC